MPARFTPFFDARSSSDWGTLRGYAEVELQWTSGAGESSTYLRHAFIDIGDRNFLRIGRNWSPYGVYVGPGGNIADGSYGRRSVNAVAYYFNSAQPANGNIAPGRGFSGFIALVDNELSLRGRSHTHSWNTDVEAGLGFGWDGGYLRGAVAYDSRDGYGGGLPDGFGGTIPGGDAWSAKLGIQQAFGAFTARLIGLYNSRPDLWSNEQNYSLGATSITGGSRWSILGGLDYEFSPKAKGVLTVQWFNQTVWNVGTPSARWTVAAGVDLKPVNGLRVRPEINYRNNQNNTSVWGGALRVERTF